MIKDRSYTEKNQNDFRTKKSTKGHILTIRYILEGGGGAGGG